MRFVLPFLAAATLAFASDAAAFPQSTHPAMTNPSLATEKAPDTFKAKFETTKGDVVFECTREWAPNGVDRFYNLVKIGFFDDVALFRVVKGFVVQWGIHGDPKVSAAWRDANLPPDPPKQSNTPGMLTYAMAGRPDTRSTQLFINYGNNANLDGMGFAPICKVVEGMQIAQSFNAEYGEDVTGEQGNIQMQGNAYLQKAWPKLDYIKTASIVGEAPAAGRASGGASKPEEGSNLAIYLVGGFLIAAAAIMMLTKKPEPEKKPEKAPEKKDAPAPKGKSGDEGSAKSDEPGDEDAPRPKKKKTKKKSETT